MSDPSFNLSESFFFFQAFRKCPSRWLLPAYIPRDSWLLLLLLSRFPIDGSPPGSPVPGILQARTLEWVAISFSNAGKWNVKVKSLSRVWLFNDSMDCSPPGCSIHGIFQARVLEWGAIAFSERQFRGILFPPGSLPHLLVVDWWRWPLWLVGFDFPLSFWMALLQQLGILSILSCCGGLILFWLFFPPP